MTKEKRYFYMACEALYGGLHGMYHSEVLEGTYKEVSEIAMEESYRVMDSYSSVMDDLQYEVNDIMEHDDYTEDEAWEEVMQNNLEFYVWEIDESKAEGLSTRELDQKSTDYGYEMFVDEYCKK